MPRTARRLVTPVTLALQLVTLAGCNGQIAPDLPLAMSDGGAGATGSTQQGAAPGMVDVQVELPAGVAVSRIAYSLIGPGGFLEMGSFAGSQVLEFVLENVPAAPGYELDVTTSSPDGSATCAASESFVVLAGMTAHVLVGPQCSGSAALFAPSSPQTSLPDASASAPPSMPSPPGTPELGSVSVSATLPAISSFSTVACELTGPNGLDFRDTLPVTSSALQFAIQNIPAGMGDALTLTATSTDGSETCRASSTFDILAQQATETTLFFLCAAAARDQ